MASIGRLTFGAVGVSNEVTMAAVNLNFDFSLVKMEAPPEYNGLRDVLSIRRVKEAEEGEPHMIARRLGALFEPLIPPIPNLIKAYGSRVSEISASIRKSTQHRPEKGMFDDYAGPNGTSIWAAATSGGQAALAVHLLGCMLARMWPGPQAISLWVEIVERRKQEISDGFERNLSTDMRSLIASRQIFDRKDLATWDASARSWLLTADDVKRFQYKQLNLIIHNIKLPVNLINDPYLSILKAWTSSLSAMELLVQGIPHRVQDGTILLTISAWHLYPEMEVLLEHSKTVHQNDPLMRGAIITIASQWVEGREGVYWSLPLSKLQYYSAPVPCEGRLASETSRVTMKEFHVVVLGMLTSSLASHYTPSQCCQIIMLIQHLHQKARFLAQHVPGELDPLPWLPMVAAAAETFLSFQECAAVHLENFQKLFALGVREGKKRAKYEGARRGFLDIPLDGLFFGLLPHDILPALSFSEDSIRLFRKIARDFESERLYMKHTGLTTTGDAAYVAMRDVGQINDAKKSSRTPKNTCYSKALNPEEGKFKIIRKMRRFSWTDTTDDDALMTCNAIISPCWDTGSCVGCRNRSVKRELEDWGFIHSFLKPLDKGFTHVWGDPDSISLVVREPLSTRPISSQAEMMTFEQCIAVLQSESLDLKAFDEKLVAEFESEPSLQCGLRCLWAADVFYESLDGATVSLVLLETRLMSLHWARNLEATRPHGLGLGSIPTSIVLSCIATFECGGYRIEPATDLSAVVALAVGDSIYVDSLLLSDPMTGHLLPRDRSRVRRFLGSLGRSELAFITALATPRLRKFDMENWKLINHHKFDRSLEDNFCETTLHLSFTDAEKEIDLGNIGLRDVQAVLLQSVISVVDRGRHIGDLNVVNALISHNYRSSIRELVKFAEPCKCAAGPIHDEDFDKLMSLDCWDELLVKPTSSVFRAYGNWQARLAGTVASAQLGMRTVVLPRDACLRCLSSAMSAAELQYKDGPPDVYIL
ncbi:hypothetical protein G7046_g4599 [Stylonectria norvegica]|nr:hypothetical protein G7046_g4599 [Stylonectria norvegica]